MVLNHQPHQPHQIHQMKNNNNISLETLNKIGNQVAKTVERFEKETNIKELLPSSLLPDTHDSWRIYFLKYQHEFTKWKIRTRV